MNKTDSYYLSKLKKNISTLKLEIAEAGGIIEVKLEDIFIPLKLNSSERPEDSFFTTPETTIRTQKKDSEENTLTIELLNQVNQMLNEYNLNKDETEYSSESATLSKNKKFHNIDNSLNSVKPRGNLTFLRNSRILPIRELILARPGYGKSTLAKRITLACINQENILKELYNLKEETFPVFLYCRSLADENITAIDDLYKAAYEITKKEIPDFNMDFNSFKEMIKEKANNGSLLLIIDGFDELLSKKGREKLAKILLDFLKEYPLVSFIITSRPNIFSDAKNWETKWIKFIPDIKKFEIKKLNSQDISEFVYKWFEVIYPNDPDNNERALTIINQLELPTYRNTRKLIKSPLDLKRLLILSMNRNSIPESSAGLYYSFIKLYLNWKRPDKFNSNDTINLLAYTAYHMTKNGQKRINQNELIKVLMDCANLFNGSFNVPVNEEYITSFILELKNRSCLLESASENSYEFSHLQFQEFLTSYALVNQFYEDVDSFTLFEIIQQNYQKESWHEIIKLIFPQLKSKRMKSEIAHFIIDEVREDKSNYPAASLLFDLLLEETYLTLPQKDQAFELLLKNHITEDQLKKLEELTESHSEERFYKKVKEKFDESFENEDHVKYCLALGVLEAFRFIYKGLDPLVQAEKMINSNNKKEFIIGLYILSVAAWCIYSNINSQLSKYKIKLKPETTEKLKNLILNHNTNPSLKCISDLTCVNFVDDSFFDSNLFNEMIVLLESDDKELVSLAETILASFPINMNTIEFHKYTDIGRLPETYQKIYENDFNTRCIDNLMDDFYLCSLLGCFGGIDKIGDELHQLDGLISFYWDVADDLTKGQLSQAKLEIWDKKDLGKAALKLYLSGNFEKAKEMYLYGYKNGSLDSANNLAYMLRRGEIDEVKIDNNILTVQDLLSEGLKQNDGFSLINNALYYTFENGELDYKRGLNILKNYQIPTKDLNEIYNWWFRLAKQKDIEGPVVLLWLLELDYLPIEKTLLNQLKEIINF